MGAVGELSARVALKPILGLLLCHGPTGTCVRGWRSAVEPDEKLPCDLEISSNALWCETVIRETLDGPVFTQVQRATAPPMDPYSGETFLRLLPELQQLSMDNPEWIEILVLSSRPSKGAVIAPKLTTLKLSRFRFGCIHEEHEDRGFDQLVETLKLRRKYGSPITRLELSNCTNAYRWAVKELRKLVPVVEDKIEGIEDEEDDPESECEDRKPLHDDYDDEDMGYVFSEPNIFDGMSSEDAYAMIPWF